MLKNICAIIIGLFLVSTAYAFEDDAIIISSLNGWTLQEKDVLKDVSNYTFINQEGEEAYISVSTRDFSNTEMSKAMKELRKDTVEIEKKRNDRGLKLVKYVTGKKIELGELDYILSVDINGTYSISEFTRYFQNKILVVTLATKDASDSSAKRALVIFDGVKTK